MPEALAHGLRVVDLSGAWRLRAHENRAIYKFHDEDAAQAERSQTASVYGLPELHRKCIRDAQLVANPGCYATSIILALKPLVAAGWVDLDRGIICDSKSGVSGAGKAPTPPHTSCLPRTIFPPTRSLAIGTWAKCWSS